MLEILVLESEVRAVLSTRSLSLPTDWYSVVETAFLFNIEIDFWRLVVVDPERTHQGHVGRRLVQRGELGAIG